MKHLTVRRIVLATLCVPAALIGIALGNWASRPAMADDQQKESGAAEQNRIVKLHVVSEDKVFTTCVEVPFDLSKNLPTDNKSEEKWDAVVYRLSDNDKVERFAFIGTATYVSPTQIAIEIHKNAKTQLKDYADLLSSSDLKKRHAIMLLPKGSAKAKANYAGKEHRDFEKELAPVVKGGGLILVPVETGVSAKATSCTCKAFFGCTSGCCTNPTCNIIIGVCQSNSNCKRVDLTSNCLCRE